MEEEEGPSRHTTIADTIKFQNFAKLLERVSKSSGKDKIKHINKFFEHFRKAYQEEHKTLDPSKAHVRPFFMSVCIWVNIF